MNLKWLLISVALATALWALLVGRALGFERTGNVQQEVQLRADMAELPPCVQARVRLRLKRVVLTDHLKDVFPGTDGDSFGFGTMFLDDTLKPPLMRIVFFHECGHFYDWASGNPSQTTQFRTAVAADFAAMPPLFALFNDYLVDPQEAFAELFAGHFAGPSYSHQRLYRLQYFYHAMPLVEGALCK